MTQKRVRSAVVNVPSVFEPLKFYCIKYRGGGEVLKTSNCSKPFSSSLLNWFDFISVMH